MSVVQKIKLYYKEVMFYVFLGVNTLMKWLDLHFVSKSFGIFALMLYACVAIIFTKSIYKMKDSKKKRMFFVLLPVLLIVTFDWFVLLAVFTMSFTVFKLYERTKLNMILKAIYGISVVLAIFSVGYIGAISNQWFQKSDEYEGYVCSPDMKHVITYHDNDVASESRLHTYYLEDVYFGLLKKESHQLTKDKYRTKLNVKWLDNESVEIDGVVFNIKEK